MQAPPLSSSRALSSPERGKPIPVSTHPLPHSPDPGPHSLLDLPAPDPSYQWDRTTRGLCVWLLPLKSVFSRFTVLRQVPVGHHLRPSSALSYRSPTFFFYGSSWFLQERAMAHLQGSACCLAPRGGSRVCVSWNRGSGPWSLGIRLSLFCWAAPGHSAEGRDPSRGMRAAV